MATTNLLIASACCAALALAWVLAWAFSFAPSFAPGFAGVDARAFNRSRIVVGTVITQHAAPASGVCRLGIDLSPELRVDLR